MILADAIEQARQADLLSEAMRLGARLKRVTSAELAGPCLVCNGTDRFSINVKKGVWHCRHCGRGGDVVDLVQHVEGVTFIKAVETLAGETSTPRRSPAPCSEATPQNAAQDAERNRRFALDLWGSSRSIRETLAEDYLVRVRGVDIEQIPELDAVLRFNPACPFGDDSPPCLIALIRNIVTDEPQAIQRTALSPDGRKIDRRGLGPKASGAIKLWPDAEVTYGLVVGEGLETVAAAATHIEHKGTLLQPAWALIDRGNLSNFAPLPGIEALTILVDADEKGDGQKAARECVRRWADAGRAVIRLEPKELGTDFNNLVTREEESAR
jgi:putative DNA primase/helicase